jgi:hypothetical protein
MTGYTRVIITPERRTVRTRCEGCIYFRGLFAYLFGFGKAHCAFEGRVLEQSSWLAGCWAFNRGQWEYGFLLPRWCPLPEESEGVVK